MVATLYQKERTQDKEKQYSGGNISPFFSANLNSPTLKPDFYPTSSEADSVLTSLYFVVVVVRF